MIGTNTSAAMAMRVRVASVDAALKIGQVLGGPKLDTITRG